jgi:hypothetical protein
MGKNYYYLVTSLPTLNFGEFNTVPVADLLEKIGQEVTSEDRERIVFFQKENDIRNLNSVEEDWETFRNLGNIPAAAFTDPEQTVAFPEKWVDYMLSQKGEKPIHIDTLWLAYFEEGKSLKSEFIDAWLTHELALRTAIALIRQEKQEAVNLSEEVQASEQPVIAEILPNSRQPNFGVAYQFDWADSLRELFKNKNPKEIEMALDQIRWQFLDAWIANRHFANEVVLAYALKLFICERWKRLDQQKGEQIIKTILGGTSGE